MKRFLISITIFAIVVSVISLFAVSPTAQAQRSTPTTVSSPTPRPTSTTSVSPTPISTTAPDTGGGKHSSSKTPATPPPQGTVWGYVIDYSNSGAPEGGVPVVIDGGGWKAETVSDSNGFYKFAGLGSGEAQLRLKLSSDAHPVNKNWRIHTGDASLAATNLGFYWGDTPPLPVVTTMKMDTVAAGKSTSLTVVVKNQSGGDAHNLRLTTSLPPELSTNKAAASSNATAESDKHTVTTQLENLPNGGKLTLVIDATAADALPDAPLAINVSLVYDEQLTPQRFSVALQPGDTNSDNAVNSEAIIPETGGAKAPVPYSSTPIVVLSALFILGLGYAGFRTVSRRT